MRYTHDIKKTIIPENKTFDFVLFEIYYKRCKYFKTIVDTYFYATEIIQIVHQNVCKSSKNLKKGG